jgi:hypothetical protein
MMIQGEKKIVVRTGSGSPKYAVTLVSRSSARQRFINYCGNRIKHTKQFGFDAEGNRYETHPRNGWRECR